MTNEPQRTSAGRLGALCNDKNARLDIILCTVYVMHTIVPSATR